MYNKDSDYFHNFFLKTLLDLHADSYDWSIIGDVWNTMFQESHVAITAMYTYVCVNKYLFRHISPSDFFIHKLSLYNTVQISFVCACHATFLTPLSTHTRLFKKFYLLGLSFMFCSWTFVMCFVCSRSFVVHALYTTVLSCYGFMVYPRSLSWHMFLEPPESAKLCCIY